MTYSLSSKVPMTPSIKTAQLGNSIKMLFSTSSSTEKVEVKLPVASTNDNKKNNG